MTALADSLDAFTRWTKTIEARFEELAEHWRVLQAHRQRIEALGDALEGRGGIFNRIEALEAKVKPGPSFTARAGETITIECACPSCEVCEARKP